MLDCHIHLERGPYTVEWVRRFVDAAATMGLDEICLLEHTHRFAEFIPMYEEAIRYSDYQKNWLAGRNDGSRSLRSYTALIDEARKIDFPIKVKFGLEVCYFENHENLIRTITSGYPFDFITGSVHWVDGFGFDHKKEFWNDMNVDHLYVRYYEIMKNLIRSGLFNGCSHPDSIKVYGHYASYDLTETYSEIADLLISHGMYTEQSGGLHLNYSKNCEIGMNRKMLEVLRGKGVDIRTASDAHCPEDVGANIEALQELLRA